MKCSNCKQQIEECKNCHAEFYEDSEVICLFGGEHICDLVCFFERFEERGEGCRATVMGGYS